MYNFCSEEQDAERKRGSETCIICGCRGLYFGFGKLKFFILSPLDLHTYYQFMCCLLAKC